MASIDSRPRRDGTVVHRVMFRVDGRQRSESFADLKAAHSFARLVERVGGQSAIEVRDARDRRPPEAPLLRDWLGRHLEMATGITEGTRDEYRRLAARTWLPVLGDIPVEALTRDEVVRWVSVAKSAPAQHGRTLSAKTIANAHGLLSTVLSSAVREGHVAGNVARGVPLPKADVDERVFLTAHELALLVAEVPERHRPLVAVLAGTGMRWGEVTALRWAEVDLDGPVPSVRVIRAWKRGVGHTRVEGAPKTKRSLRTISLAPELVNLLRPMRRGPGDLVFTAAQGGPVRHQNFRSRVWGPAVGRFAGDVTENGRVVRGPGKRPRIHDLRHSHASFLLGNGVDVLIVQARLGHESAQTTLDVYGHAQSHAGRIAAATSSIFLTNAFPSVEEDSGRLLGALALSLPDAPSPVAP